jgi:hypothetical protein
LAGRPVGPIVEGGLVGGGRLLGGSAGPIVEGGLVNIHPLGRPAVEGGSGSVGESITRLLIHLSVIHTMSDGRWRV